VHTTKTFILRLLINPDAPGILRGALQQRPEGETHHFTDEQALLAYLHRLACCYQEPTKTTKVDPEIHS